MDLNIIASKTQCNAENACVNSMWQLGLSAVCIMNLDKLNLVKLYYGGLVLCSIQLFATAPAASKNDACCKSGQKLLKNNHLALFTKRVFHNIKTTFTFKKSLASITSEYRTNSRVKQFSFLQTV